MADSVLLVDFENIGKLQLGAIPTGVRVPFFFGASQKSVPTEFLKAALKLGERFVPIDIEGQGKNALDFHIAFYLGEYLTRSPDTPCVILSKDKGFDPLIKHLAGRGFSVRRATSITDAVPAAGPAVAAASQPPSALWDNALSALAGMQKNRRPRKRKGLLAYLHSHFRQRIAAAELQRLIDQMIGAGKLSEVNGTLTYHF